MASTPLRLLRCSLVLAVGLLVTPALSFGVLGQDPTGRPTEPPKKKPTTKPASPPVKPESRVATVILTVLTDPSESVVFIDGERRGTTNKEGKFVIERMPLGHHTVEVQKKDYHAQVRGFEAGADSPTLKFTLEPKLDDIVSEFDSLVAAGKLMGPETPNALEVVRKLAGKFPDRPETQRMRGVLSGKLAERVTPVIDRTISAWRMITPDELSAALESATTALDLRGDDMRVQAQVAYLSGARAFREWQMAGAHAEGEGGGLATARAELEKATKADEHWGAAQYQLGRVLLNIPDANAAEAALLKAVQLEPKWAPAHAGLGSAYFGSGKLKESIASFRKAIEIDPKYAAAYAGLGLSRATKGEVKDGIKDIERAKELDPASGLPHWYLGSVYSQSTKAKEIAMAIEEIRKAIQKNPDNLEFQNDPAERLLASLQKRKGK
ncbi:MAG TPA: tetratricopeptide repeat protein [Blastocatellia bacterium]|nr:tetratricopeptide repeat protein [Blastocatellia bacterium]